MNSYETEFFCQCPKNGIRIKYSLNIQTNEVVMVEDILAAVSGFQSDFHEQIADRLHQRFGGLQTMSADHHGVRITTHRG